MIETYFKLGEEYPAQKQNYYIKKHRPNQKLYKNAKNAGKQEMKKFKCRLSILAIVLTLFIGMSMANAATLTLAWDPNSETDLAGYKIYYGTASGNYSNIIDVNTDPAGWDSVCGTVYDPFKIGCANFTLRGLIEGETYYIAATAYDTSKNESAYSVELIHTVDPLIVNTYTAYRISSSPHIDGDISEFTGANTINISGSNANGTYRIVYDNTALYIGAVVSDSDFNTIYTTRDTSLWQDDSIELFFDTLNNAGAFMNEDDYKFFVNLSNTQYDTKGGTGVSWNAAWSSNVNLDGTLNNNTDTDVSYTIEIAIPWLNWGIGAPSAGQIFGFDLSLNDRNAAGIREQIVWNNSDGGSSNNPDGWSDIVFSDIVIDPDARTYEDAENGNTLGWRVYDNTPDAPAPLIENIFDNDRGNRVIKLTGQSKSAAFTSAFTKRTKFN